MNSSTLSKEALMEIYKVKYIVIVEDQNGNFIEQAVGPEHYWDTEKEAKEFADDMNELGVF
jgi:hypothetical protein